MRRGAVAASAKSNLSGRAPNESASSTGLVMDVVYNETHPKIPHHHQRVVNGFHHIVIMI